MLAAPRYLGLASLVNDGPVAMLELSRLFELAGGTRGMTNRPFDLERPPSPRFLSACTPLSLSLFPSLSTPFNPLTELIGKSIGGTAVRRKNKSKEGAKEKRSPPVFAGKPIFSISRSHSSLHLHIFLPSLASSRIDARACTTTDPIILCLFPRQHARYASADSSAMRLFEFSLRFPPFAYSIVLYMFSAASARSLFSLPSSFCLSCKILKIRRNPPPQKSTWISNTIR